MLLGLLQVFFTLLLRVHFYKLILSWHLSVFSQIISELNCSGEVALSAKQERVFWRLKDKHIYCCIHFHELLVHKSFC